jgi:hypothetical protein
VLSNFSGLFFEHTHAIHCRLRDEAVA